MTLLGGFRLALAALGLSLLGGCYTAETVLFYAGNSPRVENTLPGRYCHAETRFSPLALVVAPQISDALGANRCRELGWDGDEQRYVDTLSKTIEFRVADLGVPELYLLQVQASAGAKARYAPLALVDGLFVMLDPAGEWPRDWVAEAGLELDDQGVLKAAVPEVQEALLKRILSASLERFRADMRYVEDKDGPRIAFSDAGVAGDYIVYFREDWSGDEARMKAAMLALADRLGLSRDLEP